MEVNYRHYETKDDVVRSYIDGIFESFRKGVACACVASREEVARLYFSGIQKNEGELRLLHDAGKAYFLYARIREHVGSNMWATREVGRAADDRYVVAAVSGVLYSITIEWIKGDCPCAAFSKSRGGWARRVRKATQDSSLHMPIAL